MTLLRNARKQCCQILGLRGLILRPERANFGLKRVDFGTMRANFGLKGASFEA